jgi:hypothetical protein
VDAPQTAAGREFVRQHPELEADEISAIELQARGQGAKADAERRDRVVDRLRHLLTAEQLGAVNAVLTLDPEAIASFDDEMLRVVLAGLSDPRLTPNLGPGARDAAREAAERYHDEIR